MTLRVLVNGASARGGGGETFLLNQVRALSGLPDLRLTVYASGSVADRLSEADSRIEVKTLPDRHALPRLFWEQVRLPRIARDYDVVYSTGNFALMAATRPQVLLLQSAHHYGRASRRIRRRVGSRPYRFRVGAESRLAHLSVRRADRVVAVSASLRAAVLEDLPRMRSVDVVHGAPPTDLEPRRSDPPGERERYVLAVAHDYPHKDWDGLLAAFLADPGLPRLKLAGAWRNPRRAAALREKIRRAGGTDRVELLGAVADRASLGELYRGAECCVVHSFLESFALTACEAMYCGLPVAASDIPAHREVCEDEAQYYPIDQPAELAAAVRRAVSAPPPGRATVLGRTWDDNAREMAEILRAAGDVG